MVKKKMMLRMNKEIALLQDYFDQKNINVTITQNEEEPIFIYIKKNNKLFYNIMIEVSENYPFESPEVSFIYKNEKIPYYEFFKQTSKYYLNIKKVKFEEHIFPCCYNLIEKREISISLLNITKDIQLYDSQLKRLKNRFYCSKYINNINNINNDVINIIIEYL